MIVTKNFLSLFNPEIKKIKNSQLIEYFLVSGIEVDKSEEIIVPSGIFYGIIEDVSNIDGSFKLNLCKVQIPYKDNESYQIVCGASNVRKGMKVVVALPGSTLSNGEIKISKRKVFGIESDGMICSYPELYKSSILTNSESFKGKILDLGEDFEVNKSYSPEDLGLDDFIMDLIIPFDRGDLTTIFGLAKDIQKFFGLDSEKFNHSFKPDLKHGTSWKIKKVLFANNVLETNNYSEYFCKKSFLFDEKISDKQPFVFDQLRHLNSPAGMDMDLSNLMIGSDVDIKLNELSSFLSVSEVEIRKIISYLEKYDYKFGNDRIKVPAYRGDLRTQRDFSEELIKLRMLKPESRYNRDKHSSIGAKKQEISEQNEYINNVQKIKEFWRNRGFFECSTFNLTNPEYFPKGTRVINPQSKCRAVLRDHALYELIDVIGKNSRRNNILRPVFEVFYSSKSDLWILNIVVPEINNKFALNNTNFSNDLLDLQSLLKRCFEYLNVKLFFSNISSTEQKEVDKKPFHSKNLLKISEKLGYMGYLQSCLPFKLWGCVVNLERYPDSYFISRSYPSIYPTSIKDISIFISESFVKYIKLGILMYELQNLEKIKQDFKSLEIVDKYELENGNKYLLRCHFQSHDKTLTKEEINGYLKTIYDYLEEQGITVYK